MLFRSWTISGLVDGDTVRDEASQSRADFALTLLSNNGVITDPDQVYALVENVRASVDQAQEIMREVKFLKPSGTKARPSWSKDTKTIQAAVEQYLGNDTPRTPTGKVSASKEALELALTRVPASDHDNPQARGLKALLDSLEAADTNVKWADVLLRGTRHPIHAYYNSLVETGRTSCMNPNVRARAIS